MPCARSPADVGSIPFVGWIPHSRQFFPRRCNASTDVTERAVLDVFAPVESTPECLDIEGRATGPTLADPGGGGRPPRKKAARVSRKEIARLTALFYRYRGSSFSVASALPRLIPWPTLKALNARRPLPLTYWGVVLDNDAGPQPKHRLRVYVSRRAPVTSSWTTEEHRVCRNASCCTLWGVQRPLSTTMNTPLRLASQLFPTCKAEWIGVWGRSTQYFDCVPPLGPRRSFFEGPCIRTGMYYSGRKHVPVMCSSLGELCQNNEATVSC